MQDSSRKLQHNPLQRPFYGAAIVQRSGGSTKSRKAAVSNPWDLLLHVHPLSVWLWAPCHKQKGMQTPAAKRNPDLEIFQMLGLMVQLETEILVKCPNNPQLLPARVSAGGGKSAVALCRLQDPPYLTRHPEGCFQCTEFSFYPPVSPRGVICSSLACCCFLNHPALPVNKTR